MDASTFLSWLYSGADKAKIDCFDFLKKKSFSIYYILFSSVTRYKSNYSLSIKE